MKNIVSTVSVIIAAGVTIGAITAVSAASAQIYTKGGYVENPQRVAPESVFSSNVGSVTNIDTRPARPIASPTVQSSQPAAIALGPAPLPALPTTMTQDVPRENAPITAQPMGTPQPSAPSGANCTQGRQAIAFDNPTINFRGVSYNYSATPPLNYAGGAAVAAIYPSLSGQYDICYSGDCINGTAGTCAAIAVAQPGGRARIYVR